MTWDALRYTRSDQDECLLWIELARKKQARVDVPWRLRMYRDTVRRTTEYIDEIGPEADHWRV